MSNPKRSLIVTANGNTAAEIEAHALQQGRDFFDTHDLQLAEYTATRSANPDKGSFANITVHTYRSATQSLGTLDLWADLPWYGKASLALTALNGVAFGIILVLVFAA